MQGFPLNNIQNAYVGNTQVQSIYLGNTLIWSTTPSPHDYSRDYLTFEALEPTSFRFVRHEGPTYYPRNIQYSLDDGLTWTTLTGGDPTPQLSTGDKILWKQTGIPTNLDGIGTFSATGNFKVYGNIMSVLYGDNFAGQYDLTGIDTAFSYLFYHNTNLVDASNLILPATTLASQCYLGMFGGCTSLITTPELPATTLASQCYGSMFNGCTSLITAPELPATTLCDWCYSEMFKGCTSLNYVKCLANSWVPGSVASSTTYWLDDVAAIGTFVKDANITWTTGESGIPSGWTVQNA